MSRSESGKVSSHISSAASSSSAKNALPSERSNVESTRSAAADSPPNGGDQLGDLVAVEAHEIETMRGARPVELGEHRSQRMAAVQVVGAEGPDHEDARVAQVAGKEHEEVAGRVIGPVQVFEDEQRRHMVAEPLQGREQVFEQGRAVVDIVGPDASRELREEAGEGGLRVADHRGLRCGVEPPVQVAERLHDRTERHRPVDEFEARADRDESAAGLDMGTQLGDEAGLAHAGLAADQERGRALLRRGGLEGRHEEVELRGPADQPGTRYAGRHICRLCPVLSRRGDPGAGSAAPCDRSGRRVPPWRPGAAG